MPDIGIALPPEALRQRALAVVTELATGGFEQRMQIEAAARILVAARRASLVAAGGAGAGVVPELAARWDSRALTAAEFAEQLPVAELSALLAAAPAWARSIRPRLQDAA